MTKDLTIVVLIMQHPNDSSSLHIYMLKAFSNNIHVCANRGFWIDSYSITGKQSQTGKAGGTKNHPSLVIPNRKDTLVEAIADGRDGEMLTYTGA